MKQMKPELYLLLMVAAVAVVGIVVLMLNSLGDDYTDSKYETVYDEDDNLVGMASDGPLRKRAEGTSGTTCKTHSDCRSGWCSSGKCV